MCHSHTIAHARADELVAIKTVDATRFRSLQEIEQVGADVLTCGESRKNTACSNTGRKRTCLTRNPTHNRFAYGTQVQEETSVLSALKHPNIIRLLEAHFLGGFFYFVMEYAEGGPLVKHIYGR